MARPKNESLHAQRQQEILQAAAHVFKSKGFHLTRTEDICAAARMSAGTLFRHFPDKRAMIMAIAEREIADYVTAIEQLATREGIEWMARITPNEFTELFRPKGFELGADSWLELARDPEGRKRLLSSDKRMRSLLSKELKRGQSEGWVRKSLDCEGAASLVLALFSGLMIDSELGLALDTKSAARAMADLFKTFILP